MICVLKVTLKPDDQIPQIGRGWARTEENLRRYLTAGDLEDATYLATSERNQVGQAALADARQTGQVGQAVVWPCGSVMCVLNCQKRQAVAQPGQSVESGH